MATIGQQAKSPGTTPANNTLPTLFKANQNSNPYAGLSLNSSGQAVVNGTASKGTTTVNGQPIGAPNLGNLYGIGGTNLNNLGITPSSNAAPTTPANTTTGANKSGGSSTPSNGSMTQAQALASLAQTQAANKAIGYNAVTGTTTPQNQQQNQQTQNTGNTGTQLQPGMIQIGGKYYKGGVETDANGNPIQSNTDNTNQQQQNQQQNNQNQQTNTSQTGNATNTDNTNQATLPTLANVAAREAAIQNDPNVQQAQKDIENIKNEYAQKGVNINHTAGFLTQATGLQGLLNQQYLTALDAANTRLNQVTTNTLTGLSQAQTALMPANVPYSSQYVTPATGQSAMAGGTSTGGLTGSIPSLAQAVANGQMTIDQANSYLGNTMGLTDQLRQAVMQINPNFNFSLSSASGATQAQGQQIQTTATAANSALDKLQTDFNNLSSLQTGGIPATNSIANWIAGAFGQNALSAYNTTLNDARAQLEGVLTATGATTPTGAEQMAMTYLPDNMTPSQFASKIAAAKTLIQQKVQAFTQSGKQTGSTSTNLYSW